MNKSYFPLIDILRFIAVLAVVLNHLSKNILPNGHLGVDVFFIISGFVVTHSVQNRQHQILDFFSRRIKRLFPMYYLTFIFGMIFALLFYNEPEQSLLTGLSSLFGISNIFLFLNQHDYFHYLTANNLFLHTWSLGVEEQFYFLVAFIYSINAKDKILKFVALLSLVSLFFLLTPYLTKEANFYLLISRFWQIGLGIFGYFLFDKKIHLKDFVFYPLMILLLANFYFFSNEQLISTLTISILTFSILICSKTHLLQVNFTGSQFLIYLGKKSYVIYLIHWPILLALNTFFSMNYLITICYFLLMMIFGFILFPLESFMHSKLKNLSNKKTTISFVFIILISFGVGFFIKNKDFTSLSGLKRIPFSISNNSIWNTQKCVLTSSNTNPNFKIDECKLLSAINRNNENSIYLYGDSYAQQIVPAILNSANHFNFYAVSGSGCPPFSLSLNDKIKNPHCFVNLEEIINQIKFKPNDKFILSFSMIYFYLINFYNENNTLISPDELIITTANSLNQIADILKQREVMTYFIGGIPTSTILAPIECLQPWAKYKIQCQKLQKMNLQDSNIRKNLEVKLVNKLKNVEYIQLFDYVQENLWDKDFYENYHDYQHLSQIGSMKIGDYLMQKLLRENYAR